MEESPQKRSGCWLLNAVFGKKNWTRRTTSSSSLPASNSNYKKRRGSSNESATEGSVQSEPTHKQGDRIIPRPGPNHPKLQNNSYHQNNQQRQQPVNPQNQPRKAPNEIAMANRAPPLSISGELDSMITDHQRSKAASTLIRASSGNVMLYGNLGNIRQSGGDGGGHSTSNDVLNYLPKTANEEPPVPNGDYGSSAAGNVGKKKTQQSEKPASLCRAISTRMDPEQLKIMGNEDYKNGRFADALALYDAAISIDPNKASYRSNKSAALTAMGRLLEAVFESREAIRIEPFYQRAHNRLSILYLRLGETEKAMYHYKHAGAESDPDVLTKARNVQLHLNRCTEAKKQRDWNTILKETQLAISAGADSAPQIFALQAEALMKLGRPQEAEEALSRGPNFDEEDCNKFFGPIGNATLLVTRAVVDMYAGRFDEAVAAAQRAAQQDPNNREARTVALRTRAVAVARSKGNDLFRSQRYAEACNAYGEGLDHDPYNTVLLYNRATCRSKIGHFDEAVKDCTAALKVRPSYRRPRIRRAECNAKLGRWEASLQDYELLAKETPEDEEVVRGLKEAKAKVSRQ
ncbi:hypothetical protein NMG60_11007313 [Bertholletia excelsa]